MILWYGVTKYGSLFNYVAFFIAIYSFIFCYTFIFSQTFFFDVYKPIETFSQNADFLKVFSKLNDTCPTVTLQVLKGELNEVKLAKTGCCVQNTQKV